MHICGVCSREMDSSLKQKGCFHWTELGDIALVSVAERGLRIILTVHLYVFPGCVDGGARHLCPALSMYIDDNLNNLFKQSQSVVNYELACFGIPSWWLGATLPVYLQRCRVVKLRGNIWPTFTYNFIFISELGGGRRRHSMPCGDDTIQN